MGVVEREALLRLCYDEDLAAEADVNAVMTGVGRYTEIIWAGKPSA